MQNSHPPKLIHKLLVLLAVIVLAVAGWLTGHILRHAVPELQHPPIRLPGEEIGKRIMDIPRLAYGPREEPRVPIIIREPQFRSYSGCQDNTNYTSLPAKCQSADGRLVRVGGRPQKMHIIPYGDWEKGPVFPVPIPTP